MRRLLVILAVAGGFGAVGIRADDQDSPDLNARILRMEVELDELKRFRAQFLEEREREDVRLRRIGEQTETVLSHSLFEDPVQNSSISALRTGLIETGNQSEFPTVNWSGFLQVDTGFVYQDEANTAAIGDIQSSTGLRRVRLRVFGNVTDDSTYLVDLDFAAEGHPSFRDVALLFHNVPTLENMHMGYFQQPFGMDAMTSGRELIFMERSLPFALAPFRQTGMRAYGVRADERLTWTASWFRFPTDAFGVNIGDSGGNALAFRATYLPVDESDDRLVHLGLDYSFGDPGNNIVRYSIEPSFFVTDPSSTANGSTVPTIVDTGDIPAYNFNLFNIEFSARNGSFLVQSEARASVVNEIGGPLLFFPGAYVTAAYILTGESHPYDRERGIFRRVIPHQDYRFGQGGGAFEVALGWAFLDLNDHDIGGGQVQTFTIGLNWYLHRYAKFQINVINALLDDPTTGNSQAVIAAVRAQVEF